MNRAKKILVLSLLAVTIGFGFWKQGKTAFRSMAEMRRPAVEAGADARILKDFFVQRFGKSAGALKLAYVSDRREAPGRRHPLEFFYDVQYGFAPLILHPAGELSDCEVLDFESAGERQSRLDAKSLTVLKESGGLQIVCREEG